MNAERVGSVFWLLFGAAAVAGGLELGLGSTGEPGPGFLACVAGGFVALMAIIVFAQSFGADPAARRRLADLWSDVNWMRALMVAGLTLAFIFALEHVGFFLSSFVLLVVIMRWIEGLPWKTALAIPVVAVLMTWLLFKRVLGISLPTGLLGF
jgi:putative tricarboxylic transport membrane protein